MQDTGKFRDTKDQFYTKETVSKSCIDIILQLGLQDHLWIEPSAGNGSFLHQLPSTFEKIGLDIEPKSNDIINQDYLTWIPPSTPIIVFGNPPFGKQSSLAKAFIKKSCQFAHIIAFILPKSFTKPSMFNAFDLHFHNIHCHELEKNSFLLNGNPYDVPCVFQIWQRRDTLRSIEPKIIPHEFHYVKSTDTYTIAIRRVGVYAGKCFMNDGTVFSPQSHYFLVLPTEKITTIVEKINATIFPSNTVGPRSLSKQEINGVLNDIIRSL